jgi:hypothetical protein
MSWLAVNNSSKAGTVFFGKEAKTVGPHGKVSLTSKPTYWTSNIKLVKSIARSRHSSSGGSQELPDGVEDEGENNG